jgi:hypothetical protein
MIQGLLHKVEPLDAILHMLVQSWSFDSCQKFQPQYHGIDRKLPVHFVQCMEYAPPLMCIIDIFKVHCGSLFAIKGP